MNRQFLEQMQSLLKDEYNDYLDEMKKEPTRGYRINLLKTDIEDFFACTDLSNEPTGFCSNGYRLRKDDTSLGRSFGEFEGTGTGTTALSIVVTTLESMG